MKITNTEVWGFKHALRGMRNPMNSWDKGDSLYGYNQCGSCKHNYLCEQCSINNQNDCAVEAPVIGKNDLQLAQTLILAGGEHSKFMRMIHVSADINMPRYWWSEEDTYHFNVKNSCSTMHKLLNNVDPITRDLFLCCEEDLEIVDKVVERLEQIREQYKRTKNYEEKTRLLVRAKRLLPEGFLQMRTLDTNYAELRNEYFQRRNHRLKEEWSDIFCTWVESLPYSQELICYIKDKESE